MRGAEGSGATVTIAGTILAEGAKELGSVCPHCRAESSRYLGTCSVCQRAACDQCGNVQFVSGERRVTHRECLRKDDDGFKMIKFVR